MDPESLEILILGLIFNEGFSGAYEDLNKYTDEKIGRDNYGYAVENLIREGLVIGFNNVPALGVTFPNYKPNNPRLTSRGREYLKDNGTLWGKMKKVLKVLKEVKQITPGL